MLAGGETRLNPFIIKTVGLSLFTNEHDRISDGKLSPPSLIAVTLKL